MTCHDCHFQCHPHVLPAAPGAAWSEQRVGPQLGSGEDVTGAMAEDAQPCSGVRLEGKGRSGSA